jgi:DNA helicase-2/ATP-dependent DNA helicase PcrA
VSAGPDGADPGPSAEQRAVIDAGPGALLVLAAVGSGKTTTLGRRIAAAVDQDLAPERAVALTFTNRAAAQLRESLGRALGPADAARVTLSTFHALCVRILRSAPEDVGLPGDFRVIDEDDAIELIEQLDPAGGAKAAFYALGRAASEAPLGACAAAAWHAGAIGELPWARAYASALAERGAIDFGGLVYLTRALLSAPGAALDRWRTAYDLVLVDEVQDTHLSEYEVIRVLAAQAQSLVLVGDLDQTIYTWRGSAPQALLAQVEADFGPLRRLRLTQSFRATRRVLAVAEALAATMEDRQSAMTAAAGADEGVTPELRAFPDVTAERAAVAAGLRRALDAGADPAGLAVLCRTHAAITALARACAEARVPTATAEQLRLYRRREVKDALALARLVVHRGDEAAARRVALHLVRGVGKGTLQRIVRAGRPLGLRLSDLLDDEAVAHGDPLWALQGDDLVVLDTETTGLNPEEDEVIEIGAVRLRGGRWSGDPADTLSLLIQNTVPVGASEAVHHLSDARLAADGAPAADALGALATFIGDLPIAGHNIGFDRRMLRAHAARLGLDLPLPVRLDTVDAARRLLPGLPDHRLGTLVAALGLSSPATHRALDDVRATVDLMQALAARARPQRAARAALIADEAPAFARLRATLGRWAAAAERPWALLRRIAQEALDPLLRAEPDFAARMSQLGELCARVKAADDGQGDPADALARVLEAVALSKESDALQGVPGVRILTMHQSKGLEFDEVWLPGLTEGGCPAWTALRAGDGAELEEELRLLYVAATRARRGLHLSWAAKDDQGRKQARSRFLAGPVQAGALRGDLGA